MKLFVRTDLNSNQVQNHENNSSCSRRVSAERQSAWIMEKTRGEDGKDRTAKHKLNFFLWEINSRPGRQLTTSPLSVGYARASSFRHAYETSYDDLMARAIIRIFT